MRKKYVVFALVSILLLGQGISAYAQSAKERYELLNLIRQEKFDLILPGAMRDNGVDMWIHVMRRGDPDAFEVDLGATMGYVIFTDRGGDRIERAILGLSFAAIADESVYDIFADESDLTEFVAERDPQVIAVNMSDWLTHADGLSHTNYLKLVDLLGSEYASRLVSSENVITDFRVRRVQAEIRLHAQLSDIKRAIMEGAYARIVPGVTTRGEIAWWAQDELLARGIPSSLFGAGSPGVMHSEVSDRSQTRSPDYAYQRGDLLSWDWGFPFMNMDTDWKRNAYILREGETELPASIQHAWDRGLQAREIIRPEIRVGRTAGETLDAIAAALEGAGFVWTPFFDDERDRDVIQALGDDPRSGVSIDSHTVGNTGNSEVAVGPSIAPFRPYRFHVMIQPNNLFSFEFIVHTWVPEWGQRLSINFEDNHIVTMNGVEFLYPPNEKIILIR